MAALSFSSRENEIDDLCLGMTFTVDMEVFGERKTVLLIEDGENVEVTDENKKEYVEYVWARRLLPWREDRVVRNSYAKFSAFSDNVLKWRYWLPNYCSIDKGTTIALSTNSNPCRCSLLLEWRLTRGIKDQVGVMAQGLHQVVPKVLLQQFDEKELEVWLPLKQPRWLLVLFMLADQGAVVMLALSPIYFKRTLCLGAATRSTF